MDGLPKRADGGNEGLLMKLIDHAVWILILLAMWICIDWAYRSLSDPVHSGVTKYQNPIKTPEKLNPGDYGPSQDTVR